MCEKLYAFLLRLFPSAFRQRYEEEALQLLRARLSSEKGFIRRLRLCFDLLIDTIHALPQAHRNSYAEPAPAALPAHCFEEVPSFRLLQKEPIRHEAIAAASLLSLTALAILMFLMSRSIPYRTFAQNSPTSPIQSVIERLNHPISPNSTGAIRSSAPQHSAGNTAATEVHPGPAAQAAPPRGSASETSTANLPARLSKQQPTAGNSAPQPPRAIAVPSPSAQNSARTAARAVQSAASPNASALNSSAWAFNISGRWAGSWQPVGGDEDFPQRFNLQQDGTRLTGTGSPDSMQQYPVINGSVDGDSVRFTLNNGKSKFFYELNLTGNELEGALSIRSGNKTRSTTVRLQRIY